MSSPLFSPFHLRGLTLPNRIVIAPMCQYSASDGSATSWHTIHLGNLALSGAALLIVEASAVEPQGRITAQDLGIWSAANEAALERVVSDIRRYSPIALGIQLAHAGRKASTAVPWHGGKQIAPADGGWTPHAPSPLAYLSHEVVPDALDAAGMERIKQAFAAAAERAERIGFDLLELHNAHGYLLHEFLSPLSNRRTDQYGGSLAGRMRFPLEVFDAVRAVWPPAKPISVRVSASDWTAGGWDVQQTVEFAAALKQRGCDVIHVSSGGLSAEQKLALGAGYQVAFAERIKRDSGLPTIAVGLITDPHQAEQILVAGQADMIALARGILYDPRWPWHAAAALGATVHAPVQYLRSQPRELKELFS